MKRFTLVTLLFAAMIVSAAAMAGAANTQELTPPPDSPSPNASGVVATTFDGPYYSWVKVGWGLWARVKYYNVYATFELKGLTPSTFYDFGSDVGSMGGFTTDESGNASGTCSDRIAKRNTPSYQVYYYSFSSNKVVVLE